MFENILLAEATEKVGEEVGNISLASIEAVINNLNLLATIGIGAIGLLVVLALFVVGYNFWVSHYCLNRCRRNFSDTFTSFFYSFGQKNVFKHENLLSPSVSQ